jgi:hypothetical protein
MAYIGNEIEYQEADMYKNPTWRKWRSFMGLVTALLFITLMAACGGGGSGSSGTDTSATLHDGDSWRSVMISISDGSCWFQVIDSDVTGSQIDATLTRISDHEPAEGTTFLLDYTENAQNMLTMSFTGMMSSQGRLNPDGESYMLRDADLTDDEGGLQLGIRATSGAGNTTLDGTYYVAVAHSNITDSEGFFTGVCDFTFNNGSLTVGALDSDKTLATYADAGEVNYTIDDSGVLTIAADQGPWERDLIGQARGDGELFVLADTPPKAVDPDPDNLIKTVFVGVKKSSGATDALLAGSWDLGDLGSKYTSDPPETGWYEGTTSMVLDSAGSGSWNSGGSSGAIDINLAADGTFALAAFNSVGAVTATGDVMFIAATELSGEITEYSLSIGIKTP